jgi:two-component system OmpR family response regulator
MKPPRLLLVEDDAAIADTLRLHLAQAGLDLHHEADGPGGRAAIARGRWDLVLLDLMLPGADGLDLCRELRQRQPEVPVIMLSARGSETQRVLGLELGADDYLPKPFEPRELVARIKALLRRGRAVAAERAVQATFRGWSFDRMRRQLQAPDGLLVTLSAAEHRLLCAFVDHPGRVLTRERLLDITRAPGVEVNERSIDLAVSRLRTKLRDTSPSAPLIRTLRGEGYLFESDAGSAAGATP